MPDLHLALQTLNTGIRYLYIQYRGYKPKVK